MLTHALHIRSFVPRISARLMWIPLCVLLAALFASAISGHAFVRGANATTIQVTGDITSGVYLDATECLPAAGGIGDVLLGTDAWRTAQDSSSQVCKLTFGAPGNPLGADLQVMDDPAAAGVGGPALRCTLGACSGHSIADYTNAAEPPVNTSAFGTQLLNVGGAASAVWTSSPSVHALNDTPDVPCHTSSIADGNCSFTWGVSGAATEIPGTYVAHVKSLVVGR